MVNQKDRVKNQEEKLTVNNSKNRPDKIGTFFNKIKAMTTMTITAADINKLRQMTGAGMMDCKKALTEAEGDFEKAIEILRKKGQKVSASRSDRDAKEGSVFIKSSDDKKDAVLIALNCETDFVAKNEEFQTLGK